MKRLAITWLGQCPQCNFEGSHFVTTEKGNEQGLHEGDPVECGQCGHGGLIEVENGVAESVWASPQYYCECDNPECGESHVIAEVGSACTECVIGKMAPQDVEPYEIV